MHVDGAETPSRRRGEVVGSGEGHEANSGEGAGP